MRKIKPKVGNAQLAKKYPVILTVDRPNFKLQLFKNLKLAEDLSDRGRPGGPGDAGRPVQHRTTRP